MRIPKISIDKSRLPALKVKLPNIKVGLRLLLYFITLLLGTISIVEAVYGYFYFAIDIIIYVVAAAGISLSCYYLFCDFCGISLKIRPLVESNMFTKRVYKDYRYRTILFTSFSFLISFFYAVMNGIFGYINHSEWFGLLAAYYIVLSVMRFTAVWYDRKILKSDDDKSRKLHELIVCRNCGILLILITITFSGAVLLLLHMEVGKSYPGFLIFAVAAYTFYKIIVSIVNMIKTKKFKSPLLATIRNIGYVDALVSLLSLQTAMFHSFGQDEDELKHQIMNGFTGATICIMILFIGIYMTYTSVKRKRLVL